MNPHCYIITEHLTELTSLTAYMNLYDFVLLDDKDKKKASLDCEIILVDLDSVDLKNWKLKQKEEGLETIPFICLSSDMGENKQIAAFQAGAQDILSLDLHPALVCQRILNLLRVLPSLDSEESQKMTKFHLPSGNMIGIDRDSREISMNNQNLHFTPREWDIFLLLVNKLNRVVSRDAILDTLQDESFEGTDRMVDSHIKNIRKKLKDKSAIITERGYGYKLRGVMG